MEGGIFAISLCFQKRAHWSVPGARGLAIYCCTGDFRTGFMQNNSSCCHRWRGATWTPVANVIDCHLFRNLALQQGGRNNGDLQLASQHVKEYGAVGQTMRNSGSSDWAQPKQ